MKYPTPYGKAEELAHQNERLVQALRRERQALAAERARIQAVEDVLDKAASMYVGGVRDEYRAVHIDTIHRALNGDPR